MRPSAKDKTKIKLLVGMTVAFGLSLCALEYGKPLKHIEQWNPVGIEDRWIEIDDVPVTIRDYPKPPDPIVSTKPILAINTAPKIVPNETRIDPGELPEFKIENQPFFPVEKVVEPTINPLDFPDRFPEFPGGEEALYKFLKDNLRYPAIAKNNRIEGPVYVKFTVDAKGYVNTDTFEILRSPHEALSKEAIRVIKLMPPWKPGMQGLRNVPVYMKLPVYFRLQ